MRVALVHDWLTGMRGGEFVLKELLRLFPESEIFTLVYRKGTLDPEIEKKKIHTSFIQKLPLSKRFYRHYLPLFPAAVEEFRFEGFDLVFSSSHCAAKGAIPPPGVPHICYCHTPMRYAWDLFPDYFGSYRGIGRVFVNAVMRALRTWDVASSVRVDLFIANSSLVRERIKRYYRREAEVVYPPVDTDFFRCEKREARHFLAVSSHVPYKRLDLLIKAFRKLKDFRLIVVGSGPLYKKHKRNAGENVELIPRVSRDELRELYCSAAALIHPAKEDFGMVMAEAQSCGVPVIAYREGGALDIIREGTGQFFFPQTSEALVEVLKKFNLERYEPVKIRENALRFCVENFRAKISKIVEDTVK